MRGQRGAVGRGCFNLVRAGFEVTSVGNGRLALDALQKDTFDLVLSDQQMPMMTGIQLCENLRQLPATGGRRSSC